jgi:hypothetical protein
MISKLHQRLGTAGFIISIVALVAALGGGAYAASGGLTGKEKKEVEKIAKKYAGKPGKNGTNGKDGAQGAAGSPGAKGEAGSNGSNGSNGAPGANGKSVTVTEIEPGEPGCAENGGASIEVEGSGSGVEVCNGEGGGGFPATLPSGKSETGSWSTGQFSEEGAKGTVMPISFPIPLAAGIPHAKIQFRAPGSTATAACPGTSEHPEAAPGDMCVYIGSSFSFVTEEEEELIPSIATVNPSQGIRSNPPNGAKELANDNGTSTSGVVLQIQVPELAALWGTWAITAP